MELRPVDRVVQWMLVVLFLQLVAVPLPHVAGFIRVTDTFFDIQLDVLGNLTEAWADTPDLQSNLAGWNATQRSPCYNSDASLNWRGVQCLRLLTLSNATDEIYEVRVIGLSLSDASIIGTLPSELLELQILSTLVLTGNPELTGVLPAEYIFLNSDSLLTLDLHDNAFSGEIPQNLSQCAYLSQLDLSGNQLNGSLSNLNFSNMRSLQTISLSSNLLTGDITSNTFKQLSQLVTLDLSNNSFTGQIPDLTSIRTIRSVNFSSNRFNGFTDLASIIDGSFSSLLSVLDLSNNKKIITDISQWSSSALGSLEQIYLNNSISGTLDVNYLSSMTLQNYNI